MKKRRDANDIARLLREVDRDLARGLTIADICRKIGIARQTTDFRCETAPPCPLDADRRCRRTRTRRSSV